MALFEQQFSGEQVAAARQAIAAGSSLRAAAAQIGCAPSTLSVRIKKAEAAEADARVRLGIRDRQPPQAARRRTASQPPASGALATAIEPAEVLRDALQATKTNGQPDWQIRISAARALATLPTEEAEPELDHEPETIVYDLPPGSSPILHRDPPPSFAPASNHEPPAEPLPEPGTYALQRRKGPMILLVKHTPAGGEAPAHILHSDKAAADILRAFGGDPGFLGTDPDADPEPNTP
jgi:hypothetical protein